MSIKTAMNPRSTKILEKQTGLRVDHVEVERQSSLGFYVMLFLTIL
jgi:hypothetical protein